jgi:hypothetical protein
MSCNKQARARLVEIAIDVAARPKCRDSDGTGNYMLGTAPNACGACDGSAWRPMADAFKVRHRAGMNPCKGPWAAAGITAAMEDAGLLVPSPGTPARRRAIALLDFVSQDRAGGLCHYPIEKQIELVQPGDIIAWKQNPDPAEWRLIGSEQHAFLKARVASMCLVVRREATVIAKGDRCSSCVWETRKGHVAVIVAVDDESITTVGWGEGPKPGRVMMRRLWRNAEQEIPVPCKHLRCSGCVRLPRSAETVLWRRPGGLYGIARPVAR